MHLAHDATVAVVDGQKLSLFRNAGQDAQPNLTALPTGPIQSANRSSGAGRSGDSDDPTQDEAGFAADATAFLNAQAVAGKLDAVLVIAAPKTLGEMRKHYHVKLKQALVGEIPKDLTGQTSEDIANAIMAAA